MNLSSYSCSESKTPKAIGYMSAFKDVQGYVSCVEPLSSYSCSESKTPKAIGYMSAFKDVQGYVSCVEPLSSYSCSESKTPKAIGYMSAAAAGTVEHAVTHPPTPPFTLQSRKKATETSETSENQGTESPLACFSLKPYALTLKP